MEGQPTPVFSPVKSHGQRSLVDCSPCGHKESEQDWATEHRHPHYGWDRSGREDRDSFAYHLRIWKCQWSPWWTPFGSVPKGLDEKGVHKGSGIWQIFNNLGMRAGVQDSLKKRTALGEKLPVFFFSSFPYQFSSVAQSCLFATPWIAAHQASLSITNSWSLFTLMSIELVMPSISSHPLLPLSIFPGIRVFPVSQFFPSGSQSIRVSASESVLPMNIQDWFPLGWTGWISLQPKGLSRVFSNTTVQKHQFFSAQLSL